MANLAIVNPAEQGTTTQATKLGTPYVDGYGRAFHYAYDTTAVARGYMAVAAATVANHNNLAFAVAPAVGDDLCSDDEQDGGLRQTRSRGGRTAWIATGTDCSGDGRWGQLDRSAE